MACNSCISEDRQQFTSEMDIHFRKLRSANKTRVLVVGDDSLSTKEIVARHFKERAWEPCGEAGSSEQAIELLLDLGPDLILLDGSTSTMGWARVADEIRRAAPAVKICVFSRFRAATPKLLNIG